MRTLVCYSGGYDSTALLLSEIWKGTTGIVDTCYFTLPNNKKSQKIERKNRGKILKHINNMQLPHDSTGALGSDEVYSLYTAFDGHLPPFELPQSYIWQQYLIMKVDLSKYDRIVLGYVKYDDFWHYRDQWEKTLKSNLKFTYYKKYPKIVFPFEWSAKKDIMKWYDTSKYYTDNNKPYIKKIGKLVVYCESPDKHGKPCGNCPSCVRHNDQH